MEEAATPLPSEETTPPVTNIYFGAIRIARAVTRFTAPDCSYLSGTPAFGTPRGSGSVLANPEYSRRRTHNYEHEAGFCQFQLFAPPHLKFFWSRNLFTVTGFESAEVHRVASCSAAARPSVQLSEVQEHVQLLFPTHCISRGNPQRTVAI